MSAKHPREICRRFRQYMADGDLDSVLSLYDEEAAFVSRTGEVAHGKQCLKMELAPLVARKPHFKYDIKQVVEAGDIAVMHTEWNVSGTEPISAYAIEVARRQADGTWRWLIGDPYTVGRNIGVLRKAADVRVTKNSRNREKSPLVSSSDSVLKPRARKTRIRNASQATDL